MKKWSISFELGSFELVYIFFSFCSVFVNTKVFISTTKKSLATNIVLFHVYKLSSFIRVCSETKFLMEYLGHNKKWC